MSSNGADDLTLLKERAASIYKRLDDKWIGKSTSKGVVQGTAEIDGVTYVITTKGTYREEELTFKEC